MLVFTTARVNHVNQLGRWGDAPSFENTMSTMSFLNPDDVEQAFIAAFGAQDRDAVVTALMRQAIARSSEDIQQRRRDACDRIVARRAESPLVTDEQIRQAREEGRH